MTFSLRIQSFLLIAGFATVVLAAQTAAVSRPAAAGLPAAPVAPTELAAEHNVTPASLPATAASDGCDVQHWPYYSSACLRGEGSVSAPRQVHLQQTSAQEVKPIPLAVASVDTVGQKSVERHPVSEMPRHRKARKTQHYASRPVVHVRQTQAEAGGSEQALAFGW